MASEFKLSFSFLEGVFGASLVAGFVNFSSSVSGFMLSMCGFGAFEIFHGLLFLQFLVLRFRARDILA